MANAVKWETVWASKGTVLTTELNALAASATTVIGTEIDNGTNLDQYGKLEVAVDFVSAPTDGGFLDIYMVTAPGGTNYPASAGAHEKIATIPTIATTAAQYVTSGMFTMQPGKTKFFLTNLTDQAFPATGSTVTLYTTNDEVQ